MNYCSHVSVTYLQYNTAWLKWNRARVWHEYLVDTLGGWTQCSRDADKVCKHPAGWGWGGGGGVLTKTPIRLCPANWGRDFRTLDLERGTLIRDVLRPYVLSRN